MFWCNRELLNRADCKAKLRKANCQDDVRLRKLKRDVDKIDYYAYRCEQAVTSSQ